MARGVRRQVEAKRILRLILLGCTALSWVFAVSASAQSAYDNPRAHLGGTGIIQMPSARMAPDGELLAGGTFFQGTQHYNLGFQALPWLETTFSYTGLENFDPLYPVYYDRSFGAKLRLWDEGDFLPAVAVGVADLVGTGVYSGEYIVASKQIGTVDFTLGVGWGRYGETAEFPNPLAELSPPFKVRPTLTTPGGTNFNVYFHGPNMGLFGGAVWHTPLEGLSLIAEYSSDTYVLETARGNFKPNNQFNFGAYYNLSNSVSLGVSWLHGNRISGTLNILTNPFETRSATISPPLVPVHVRAEADQRRALDKLAGRASPQSTQYAVGQLADAVWQKDVSNVEVLGDTLYITITDGSAEESCKNAARNAQELAAGITTVTVRRGNSSYSCAAGSPVLANVPLHTFARPAQSMPGIVTIDARNTVTSPRNPIRGIRTAAQAQQINIVALQIRDADAFVYYENTVYFSEYDLIDRLARVLMTEAPPETEVFHLIPIVAGVPQREFTIYRSTTERNYVQDDTLLLRNALTSEAAPMDNPVFRNAWGITYPRFDWTVYPGLNQSLFDPNQPLGLQLLAGGHATLELFPGFVLDGAGEVSLFDSFETSRLSNSELPHVRSDFVHYFTQGKNGIVKLAAEYRFRISPSLYAVAKAGYLESMFAGAGGEILWRPENQRWALGFDLYGVQQRDFNRLFGFQNYSVVTGHVSLYYQSPWYDLNFAVRAGRYLAGDNGITFELTRRFDTGVEIGAFMTKTNISALKFGEGSFDKGIMIRIPLGWMAAIDTQGMLQMDLRPVQRDGGQRLFGDTTLYAETFRASAVRP